MGGKRIREVIERDFPILHPVTRGKVAPLLVKGAEQRDILTRNSISDSLNPEVGEPQGVSFTGREAHFRTP